MNPHVCFKVVFQWKWTSTNFTNKLAQRTGLWWALDIFILTTSHSKRRMIWMWIMNIKAFIVVLIQISLIFIFYKPWVFKSGCVLRWHHRFCIQVMHVSTNRGLFLRTEGCFLLSCLIKVFQITTWKNTRMRHSACWNILTLQVLVLYIHTVKSLIQGAPNLKT